MRDWKRVLLIMSRGGPADNVARRAPANVLLVDVHRGTHWHLSVKHGHILIVHAYTPVTHGLPNRGFLVGPVNQIAISDLELVRAQHVRYPPLRATDWWYDDFAFQHDVSARSERPIVAELIYAAHLFAADFNARVI